MGIGLQKGILDLDKKIYDLSDMVDIQIKRSVRCFLERNLNFADEIIADDANVNQLRWSIEELCIDLIATQQPVALDLRKLVSATHIIEELERMGDYAKGIAVVTKELPEKFDIQKYPELMEIFTKMQELSCKMLEKSMEALLTRNREEAINKSIEVCAEDDAVDDLCVKVYDFIHSFRDRRLKDMERKDIVMKLSWIAHDLERIADRCTNIAERTIYLVTGRIDGVNPSRY